MNLLEQRPPVTDFLFEVNDKLNTLSASNEDEVDIIKVVPDAVMDEKFLRYVQNSNIQ
jgi:hypothetical protein